MVPKGPGVLGAALKRGCSNPCGWAAGGGRKPGQFYNKEPGERPVSGRTHPSSRLRRGAWTQQGVRPP